MKKFLLRIVFFILPIVFFSYFFDVIISNSLKKSNSYAFTEYSTWNAIIEGKVNSEIVIYGSSRAWVHINPTMISDSLIVSAYNLGIDGHNFWLQYLRHSLLLQNNTKPKLIIHSLDIYTLQKTKDLYNSEQFLPYMLWNEEIKNATISYNGYDLIDYVIPLIRYYGKLDAIKAVISLSINPRGNRVERIRGYQGEDVQWNTDFDKAKKTMKFYEVSLDTASVLLFERYLNECKANNIKIIFVYTPEYIEGQKFVKNRNEIISLYTELSKKYDIPFYDYSNDTISFQKKYFYNASHLNKTGSELFTNKLIEKLKESISTIRN